MSNYLQVSTTIGNRDDADRIATELVTRRLAACVQISGPVHSTYHWQGQIEHSPEWLCTAKSRQDKLAGITELLEQVHPYDVPELIATPITDGSPAYLKWLDAELDDD